MSELIHKGRNDTGFRGSLLVGTSALAMTAYIVLTGQVRAEGEDQPTVWIELGGQLSQTQSAQDAYSPLFLTQTPSIFSSQQKFERPPKSSFDKTGAISFQPKGSNWLLSASVRYGRSSANKHVHQQTYPSSYPFSFGSVGFFNTVRPLANRFTDAKAKESETHAVVDFQVGRDVGLGLFGGGSSAVVGLGVRIAQFTSSSRASFRLNPDWHFSYKYATYPTYGAIHSKIPAGQPYHSFAGQITATRSFHGIGPSLSWKASTPIVGRAENTSIAFDWGVNAAVLFGRQKAHTHHQTTGRYHPASGFNPQPGLVTTYQGPPTPDHVRSRSVVVPNVGGFAGLSFRYAAARVSFGYRGDFFFGAMDGGIDAAKSYDRNFFGPYATISVGLGG